jgi:membrane protein YqaA with SNARE-associated domain
MALARRDRAFYYAGLCTVASVIGGLLGYFIGAVLYDSVGAWLIHLYGYGDKVEAFRDSYARWGALIILLKGLTPIPYKLVTITSGFAGYSLPLFVLFSAITRAGRFFLVAGLIYKFGPQAKEIIEKRLEVWTFIFLGVVVVGVVAAVYLF